MIQSQIVTPPLAAIDGTTLRLKTATTKRRTRSQRPRTRRRCGASDVDVAAGEFAATGVVAISFDNVGSPREADEKSQNQTVASYTAGQAGAQRCCAPTRPCRARD